MISKLKVRDPNRPGSLFRITLFAHLSSGSSLPPYWPDEECESLSPPDRKELRNADGKLEPRPLLKLQLHLMHSHSSLTRVAVPYELAENGSRSSGSARFRKWLNRGGTSIWE